MQRPNQELLDQHYRGLHREGDRPRRQRYHHAEEGAFEARLPVRLSREKSLAQGMESWPERRVSRAGMEVCRSAPQARPRYLETPIGPIANLRRGRAHCAVGPALPAILECRFHVSIARRLRALRILLLPAVKPAASYLLRNSSKSPVADITVSIAVETE